MKSQKRGGKKAEAGDLQKAFGPLWKYYSAPDVSDILIDAFDRMSVERKGKLESVPSVFGSGAALNAVAKALRELPGSACRSSAFGSGEVLDIHLPDRTVVTRAEGETYSAMTIKKAPVSEPGWDGLVKLGCLPEAGRRLFERITERGESLLVTGGAASGKTTTLSAAAGSIPAGRRIVAVETAPELRLERPSCLRLGASSDEEFAGLLRNAARFLPDYLVTDSLDVIGVPEIVKAMREGIPVLASCHADGVLDALKRLELMYLSAKTFFGLDEIRAMLASGLRYVSHQERGGDGKRRLLELSRIAGYENGRYVIEPLLKYNGETKAFDLTPAGGELLG